MDDITPSHSLWMPWFIKEHRGVASPMSHLEHSAYTYLVMLCWEHDGELPNDEKYLAKRLHITVRQFGKIRDILFEQFIIKNNTIIHPQIVKEVNKAKANIAQKRAAGIASAAAKKAKAKSNGCSTGVITARQPRAGSGEGEGPYQENSSMGYSTTREEFSTGPFSVLDGGKS